MKNVYGTGNVAKNYARQGLSRESLTVKHISGKGLLFHILQCKSNFRVEDNAGSFLIFENVGK